MARTGGNCRQQTAAIEAGLREGRKVVRPFVYQAIAERPSQLQICASLYAADQYPQGPAMVRRTSGGRDKIRIGYLSGEFREQATAHLMAGLYECHDRARFEIIAIDNGKSDGSAMRKRLEKAFDRFGSHRGLERRGGGAENPRPRDRHPGQSQRLFRRPAHGGFRAAARAHPGQYLGFPGTLGAPYIDYIVADPVVLPEEERPFYTEKIVYLPGCYQVNDSRRAIGESTASRADHGLPRKGFVFCNFNQSYKLTPAMFAAWMRILKAVPGSVLWLLDSQSPFAGKSRGRRRQRGRRGRAAGVRALPAAGAASGAPQLADLFLDTLPYNAHTTASDALWSGVPLLTCRGTTFPGRVAASLLQAAGLPDLIVENLADYEARAIALAGNPKALKAIKTKLAANRTKCALFDTDGFARGIEQAYLRMWQIRQAGGAPEHFSVTR